MVSVVVGSRNVKATSSGESAVVVDENRLEYLVGMKNRAAGTAISWPITLSTIRAFHIMGEIGQVDGTRCAQHIHIRRPTRPRGVFSDI